MFYLILYAFATSVYHLFVAYFFIGLMTAVSDIFVMAYMFDITAPEQKGTLFTFYTMLNGVSTFFGSLLGGYAVQFFPNMGLTQMIVLQFAYEISAVGRLAGGLLFIRIEEPTIIHQVREEFKQIINEDIGKVKKEIERVDKAEVIKRELKTDFESLEDRRRSEKKKGNRKKPIRQHIRVCDSILIYMLE